MNEETRAKFRYDVVVIILLLNLAVGFGGGWLAASVFSEPSITNPEIKQEVVLSEGELISDIAKRLGPSVVSINVETESVGIFGSSIVQDSAGTGIILTEDGLILTNKHVVPEDSNFRVVLSDGTEYSDIEVLGRDPFNDVAFIKIREVSGLTPAPIGDSSQVQVGDQVIAIGNALGQFANTVTSGIISGLGRPIVAGGGFEKPDALQNLFQTDASINPGNSGGPLMNLSGEVIGVNTAVAGGAENIGFAIPVNDVKAGIESVKSEGRLVKPYLGVRYIGLTDSVATELSLDVKRGAYVFSDSEDPVLADSPAEKGGVKKGDIITKVNGEDINESNSLVTLIGRHKVGEEVSLTVLRGGGDAEQTLTITLEEAPNSLF